MVRRKDDSYEGRAEHIGRIVQTFTTGPHTMPEPSGKNVVRAYRPGMAIHALQGPESPAKDRRWLAVMAAFQVYYRREGGFKSYPFRRMQRRRR